MSVRKRTWKTANGESKEAWIADYVDQAGKRHIKTFDRKKDADTFHSKANVEVVEGTHTADSASITITQAADLLDSDVRGPRLRTHHDRGLSATHGPTHPTVSRPCEAFAAHGADGARI